MVPQQEELLKIIEESPNEAYVHGEELVSLLLMHLVKLQEKRINLETDEISINELLEDATNSNNKDLLQEYPEELERLELAKVKLEKRIKTANLPKDEDNYQSAAIIEIRVGTGGKEATLFALEL
jgi:protein subunit release factor A